MGIPEQMENEDAAQDNAGVLVPPPLLFVAALALGFLLQHIWPVSLAPAALAVPARVLGWVVIALGVVLNLLAFREFRLRRTSVIPRRPTTSLAFTGPYRFTRNPMYLSFTLITAGVSLVANALWPLLCLPLAVLTVRRWAIDREERYLERKFGAEYLAYKSRVRRWL